MWSKNCGTNQRHTTKSCARMYGVCLFRNCCWNTKKEIILNETNFSIIWFLSVSLHLDLRLLRRREALKAKQFVQKCLLHMCDCVHLCDSVCSIHTENDYCGSYCIRMNEQTSKQASTPNTDSSQRHSHWEQYRKILCIETGQVNEWTSVQTSN